MKAPPIPKNVKLPFIKKRMEGVVDDFYIIGDSNWFITSDMYTKEEADFMIYWLNKAKRALNGRKAQGKKK